MYYFLYSSQAGLYAIPYRTSMITSLRDAHLEDGQDPMDEDVFFANLKSHVDELSAPLDVIIRYYDEKGLNSCATV